MKDQMDRLVTQMVEAGVFFQDAVSEFEKKYIRKVLELSRGNQTKAATGHDENISFAEMADRVGSDLAQRLRQFSLALYGRATQHAEKCRILLADTKFEFGTDSAGVLLIDEVLTPDSSRFWPLDEYRPGGPQPSFDKQYVRDYVEAIGWNKQPPAPALSPEVVQQTTLKYLEIFRRLTGRELN